MENNKPEERLKEFDQILEYKKKESESYDKELRPVDWTRWVSLDWRYQMRVRAYWDRWIGQKISRWSINHGVNLWLVVGGLILLISTISLLVIVV